jgi:hypothetical protein
MISHETCGKLGIVEFEVVVGGEKYSPVQYNFFDNGEVRIKVRPNPDESFVQAFERTHEIASACGKEQFNKKLEEYIVRLNVAATRVAESARRGNTK